VLADGTLMAWGYNASGQLGDGTTTEEHTPIPVGGLAGGIAVAAGESHSLALLADGTVASWGNNTFGELGDGTTTERHKPVQVSDLSKVVAIAAGEFHSLAVLSTGVSWERAQLPKDTPQFR